ncbi:MAG: ATP-binding protein [Bryobacteraceae bacterium]|nr:ATP-binding protein [Bryobacteraceae bacterium]
MAKLKREVLGPKSEKMPRVADELKKGTPRDPEEAKRARQARAAARKAKLAHQTAIHSVPKEQRHCPACGGTNLKPLGNGKESVVYEYVPAHFVAHKHTRETLACPCGEHVVTAEGPPKWVEKTHYAPSFVASVITSKCADATPRYRPPALEARRAAAQLVARAAGRRGERQPNLSALAVTSVAAIKTPIAGRLHRARFVVAADLVAGQAKNTLHRRLTAWAAPDLLLINELGYLSFNARGAHLLYQVINRHYQRASTLHHRHHNLPFKDWGKLFHNSAAASVIADRLVHKGLLVRITGSRAAQTRNSNQHRPKPALCRSLTRPAARALRLRASSLSRPNNLPRRDRFAALPEDRLHPLASCTSARSRGSLPLCVCGASVLCLLTHNPVCRLLKLLRLDDRKTTCERSRYSYWYSQRALSDTTAMRTSTPRLFSAKSGRPSSRPKASSRPGSFGIARVTSRAGPAGSFFLPLSTCRIG